MATPEDDDDSKLEIEAWSRHRKRFAPGTVRIHGHTLATWAAGIITADAERIETAVRAGLMAGESATDIAHRVVGSTQMKGSNGATELTRQAILRLGKGYLHGRKTRMSGVKPDVRLDSTEKTDEA